MTIRLRTLAAMPLVVALLLAPTTTSPAAASCAGPPEAVIADAGAVFVGTVLEQGPTAARLEVHEVWRGPDLAPEVRVRTSMAEERWWAPAWLVGPTPTSVDANLQPGQRYVVATSGDDLATNACLVTPTSDELVAKLAPAERRAPVADGATGSAGAGGAGAVLTAATALAVLAAATAGWFASRRRRTVQ